MVEIEVEFSNGVKYDISYDNSGLIINGDTIECVEIFDKSSDNYELLNINEMYNYDSDIDIKTWIHNIIISNIFEDITDLEEIYTFILHTIILRILESKFVCDRFFFDIENGSVITTYDENEYDYDDDIRTFNHMTDNVRRLVKDIIYVNDRQR